MQTVYHTKLVTWSEENLFHSQYPLRPIVGLFYRLATLLLITLMAVSVMLWLTMRIIYLQPQPHVDDFSGYEALLPGETSNPEDFGFQILQHTSRPEEMNLDVAHTNTYMNTGTTPQVIVIDTPYRQKQIVRFSVYSKQLHLSDLMWRWGRPTYKQKDIVGKHWDFKWLGDNYTVSVDCHTLKLEAPVALVIITLN